MKLSKTETGINEGFILIMMQTVDYTSTTFNSLGLVYDLLLWYCFNVLTNKHPWFAFYTYEKYVLFSLSFGLNTTVQKFGVCIF